MKGNWAAIFQPFRLLQNFGRGKSNRKDPGRKSGKFNALGEGSLLQHSCWIKQQLPKKIPPARQRAKKIIAV